MRFPTLSVSSLCLWGLFAVLAPAQAAAFCGFYVAGSSDDLYNDATQVALMRDGTTTVLSMENNYRGPLEDFAMVIPVPQILMQDDVKTLPPELFRYLDKFTAPRLVQYWEKDPCKDNVVQQTRYINGCDWGQQSNNASPNNTTGSWADMGASEDMSPSPPPMIEAQFAVGEYEVLILSSEDATGLETWLVSNGYNIPAGATAILEQYIQQGMYFFVAKVDPSKVTFEDGEAVLSPLRFNYTSETFSLPVRLGMVNSAGEQDLLVYTLADGTRYEVSNYPNVPVPTNMNVTPEVKGNFPAFYEKVFSRTLSENPGAIVTEYAWGAAHCDPCTEPPIARDQMATLGADVIFDGSDPYESERLNNFVITRLHARYGKNSMTQDLMFSAADSLTGGTGTAGLNHNPTQQGRSSGSTFQGRYIIHNQHPGEYTCEHKVRGRWTAPAPQGQANGPVGAPGPNTTGGIADSEGLAGKSIEQLLDGTVPATGEPKVEQIIEDLGVCDQPGADNYMEPPREKVIESDQGPVVVEVDSETGFIVIPADALGDGKGGGGSKDDDGGCSATPTGGAPAGGALLGLGIVLAGGLARRRRLRG